MKHWHIFKQVFKKAFCSVKTYLLTHLLISLDEVCNPRYAGGTVLPPVLTKYKLSNMIDPSKTKTYLYVPAPPHGEERVYISAGETHAEDYMLAAAITPPEFWITNSPCPVCARKLMAAYADSLTKAEINIRRFYKPPPGNARAISKATDCLAKMIYQGFKLYDWDWVAFYNEYLRGGNEKCIDVLKKAANNEEKFNILRAQYVELQKVLAEAKRRSRNLDWIRNIATKCQP